MEKRGIAKACLTQAIKKSCFHAIAESLDNQAARLRNSGYPQSLIGFVAETILSVDIKGRQVERKKTGQTSCGGPVDSCIVSSVKKVASRHEVPVVFSAPQKLSKLCSLVDK